MVVSKITHRFLSNSLFHNRLDRLLLSPPCFGTLFAGIEEAERKIPQITELHLWGQRDFPFSSLSHPLAEKGLGKTARKGFSQRSAELTKFRSIISVGISDHKNQCLWVLVSSGKPLAK
jgi:hypothetical protein